MKFTGIIFAVALSGDIVGSLSLSLKDNNKHPLEDTKSWDLHVSRQLVIGDATAGKDDVGGDISLKRQLETTDDNGPTTGVGAASAGNKTVLFAVKHIVPKNHIPFAGGDTTHGMMIDAGSQGSRLHIYEWDKRFLLDQDDLLETTHGKKLSYPTSNSRWTDQYLPGLDMFIQYQTEEELENAMGAYLGPLVDFAKEVLKDKKDEWHTYPIYLKATGGLRTLSHKDRVRLMDCVIKLFNDKIYNPFDFNDERARVISGEEEAIYGWVGVNFAKNVLIEGSEGSGLAKDPKLTYGMLEMGGASTQIANFENNGDMMANLFKLQLGGSRHWNVYVHSYLYSGINGAWSRLNSRLHWEGTDINPCLPTGSTVEFESWMHMDKKGRFYPRDNPKSTHYSVSMTNNATNYDHAACSKNTFLLLRKETNKEWCDFQMDGDCGFAGIYQPPLPKINSAVDEFIATSNFVGVYEFLQLGEQATVSRIGKVAEKVCSLSWKELKEYNANLKSPIKEELVLAQFCFRSNFVYQLLRHGWEFGDEYVMTAADVINGQKMGWALGCMLYEINTLPWDFHPELLLRGPGWWIISLYIVLGTFAGSAVGFMLAMRMSKKFNKTVRQSQFFKKSAFANNSMVRKSLAMPDVEESLEELNHLYDDDEKVADENAALAEHNARLNRGPKYT